jgi:hypothetical protein
MTAAAQTRPAGIARLREWWFEGTPAELKFVYLVLLANGLPAFTILLSIPDRTEDWFVWTVAPEANARLLAVMYGNALLLVIFGMIQGSWLRARVTMVAITFFTLAATISTFFNLDVFLEHPWSHLTYWLTMYIILCALAPLTFILLERRLGGRQPVEVPLTLAARLLGVATCLFLFAMGISLVARADYLLNVWPWPLQPTTGGMIGVWFTALGLAFVWALWDGDWLRVRPIFWQAVPTGICLGFIPLVHRRELVPEPDARVAGYLALALGIAALHLGVILYQGRGGTRAGAGARVMLGGGMLSLDVIGLVVAGLVNTFLSPIVSELMLSGGIEAQVRSVETRALWVADHVGQWRAGWTFWFVVTLSFAWSYYALARNLGGPRQWGQLAIGLALVAAAIDIVGLVTNITVVPALAASYADLPVADRPDALLAYGAFEALASDLINIAAFGLYSVAGLALVPAMFLTDRFPRLLAWLGTALWVVACVATALLALEPGIAYGALVLSFLLFAPWVWGSAWWLYTRDARERTGEEARRSVEARAEPVPG